MSAEFPFTGNIQATNPASLPLFREWAWDFDKDCFKRDSNGNMILLSGNDALQVWVYKAVRTERWAFLAYSDAFGIELEQFRGKVMTVGERRSELRRAIKECLMVNPYVVSVDKIEFESNERGRVLNIRVELTTVYGSLEI